jgi:hypothetical protein
MPPTRPQVNDTLDVTQPLRILKLLFTRPQYFWLVAFLVLIGDAALCQLIIRFIPCESLKGRICDVATSKLAPSRH